MTVYKFLLDKAPDFKDGLIKLKKEVIKKFKILVMTDLVGTLFHRGSTEDTEDIPFDSHFELE